ncbi:MAG TPA: ATP-binding protein, partial [Candidatus Limnocylindrales bacterium]|nr:ATP-binding protein [Candidatus Limnocylindrales bacterium]
MRRTQRFLGRIFRIRNLRFMRGLRFRLTLSYVLFFAVLLVLIGLVSRGFLKAQLEGVEQAALDEEWDAAKGYVSIKNYQPVWDPIEDDQDRLIEDRLKQVYFIADSNGNSIGESDLYTSIGRDSVEEIKRVLAAKGPTVRVRNNADGIPYMIEAGALFDKDSKQRYFLAIGRSLEGSHSTVRDFTRRYFLAMPLMIAICATLGWLIAGRAIRPVNLIAQAAQNITGSNLSLRIPRRGAGDELDNLVDSFNRMTARLHQSFEQIRRFSTDVSHELRTPLTAIRGQLEVAVFTAESPEQYREAAINALEDVEKLSSIVRTLLLLSQAESGQVVLQKSLFDLNEVVTDIVDQFQIPAEDEKVTLTAELAPETVLSADRTQIERLLSNLLSNAVKYTPAGGHVTVRVGPAEELGWAQLVVEDTGVGIAATNLPHIFDRFYRVRNAQTGAVQGLGLGLSFVAWIVEAHGGRIDVSSTEGQGSRFTVLLPTG